LNGDINDQVTHNPDFKDMPLFDIEYLRNGTRYSCNVV